MHLWTSCSALLAGLTVVAGQFSFPIKSTSLNPGERCLIRWNTHGLQGPLSINLIPSGSLGSNIIAQRIAVNIENTGILPWAPDLTIANFAGFSMVILDARSSIIISDPFRIGSLTQQPAMITTQVPQLATLTSKNNRGQAVTQTVTMGMTNAVVPSPTGAIKLHQSGTQVLDSLVGAGATTQADAKDQAKTNTDQAAASKQATATEQAKATEQADAIEQAETTTQQGTANQTGATKQAEATEQAKADDAGGAKGEENNSGLKPLPGLKGSSNVGNNVLQPLPNVAAQGSNQQATTSQNQAKQSQGQKNDGAQQTPAPTPTPTPTSNGQTAKENKVANSAAASSAPGNQGKQPGSVQAASVDNPGGEVQAADVSLKPLPGAFTTAATLESLTPRPTFTTLTDVTLSPAPIKATGEAQKSGSSAMSSSASGMTTQPGMLAMMAGLAALAAAMAL